MFYFIALGAGLCADPRLDHRLSGEAWQVHGGGFYTIRKYTPSRLIWFIQEACGTWIFGFALPALAHYLNPFVYPIEPSVMNIDAADAVPAFAALRVMGWFVYNLLCPTWFRRKSCSWRLPVLLCWLP